MALKDGKVLGRKEVAGIGDDGKPSTSVTGKGGVKVIDGSSVVICRFAEPHWCRLTDLVIGDGSSMAAGFYAVGTTFFVGR